MGKGQLMKRLPSLHPTVARLRTLAVALVVGSTVAISATAQANASTYAMLPLVAGDTGVPYQVFASKAERTTYGDAIARGIRARDGGTRIAKSRVENALATAGIDQESPYRACNDAACARKIGRAVRAIAEDRFPFSTGAVFDVDGGFHLHRL